MSEAKELEIIFSDFCNKFNSDEKELIEILSREHRTVQQRMAKIVFAMISKWLEMYKEKDYDGRNEATVQLCNQIVEKFGDNFYFPCI